MPADRAIVVIPTYNEAENIGRLVSALRVLYPDMDIMVVDDNSPDATAAVAAGLARQSDRVRVLQRQGKEGLGRAYVHAFRHVLSQPVAYDLIIQMDADFSHDPVDIKRMLEAAGRADVVLGSRYSGGGSIVSWGIVRRCLSAGANIVVRLCLGSGIRDWTGGFRIFRRNVIERISVDTIRSKGYLFQVEVLNRCIAHGCSIEEVPISFVERSRGRTKLGVREVIEAVCGIARLAREARTKRYHGTIH